MVQRSGQPRGGTCERALDPLSTQEQRLWAAESQASVTRSVPLDDWATDPGTQCFCRLQLRRRRPAPRVTCVCLGAVGVFRRRCEAAPWRPPPPGCVPVAAALCVHALAPPMRTCERPRRICSKRRASRLSAGRRHLLGVIRVMEATGRHSREYKTPCPAPIADSLRWRSLTPRNCAWASGRPSPGVNLLISLQLDVHTTTLGIRAGCPEGYWTYSFSTFTSDYALPPVHPSSILCLFTYCKRISFPE